jgi:hypothetical protein
MVFLTEHLVVGQALEEVQLDSPGILERLNERLGVYGVGTSLVPATVKIGSEHVGP